MDIPLSSSVPQTVQAELNVNSMQITIQKLIERINRKVAHRGWRMRTTRASGGIPGLYQLLKDGKPDMVFDDVDLKQIALDLGALREWEGGVEIVDRSGVPIKSVLRKPQPVENVPAMIDEASQLAIEQAV
jgi:hypothetical protein